MNPLDRCFTLPARRGPKAARRGASGGAFCLRLIALTLAAVLINVCPLNANETQKITTWQLKLYAYNQMNWQQMECYNWLIWLESRWNPKAINGSHYGLGQMRNKKVKYLNGYQQIDWHLRYLKHRYNGDACAALKHLNDKGWH
jgi:hypothetical protein